MKEFCLRVRGREDGGVTIDGSNDGFTIFELISFLDLKRYDLLRQAHEPDMYIRTAKLEDGTVVDISEKENRDVQ